MKRKTGLPVRTLRLSLIVSLSATAPLCKSDSDVVLRGFTMGTNYQIRMAELPAGASAADLKARVDRLLAEINGRMSTWDPRSELSRLNRAPANQALVLSDETGNVIRAALRMSRASGGAFDPTIPPLLRLWGFGAGAQNASDRTQRRPSAAAIRKARAKVGFRRLRLPESALIKTAPDIEIDLSAIAKGHAVDRVFELLRLAGVESLMVEIGGEIRVGSGRRGRPWRIGLERPNYEGGQEVLKIARVQERAVATSGDYRNYFEIDGRRYSHVIDPRSGEPARSRVRAATVIGPDCRTADAMATALLVLGREAGLALCDDYTDFECMLVLGADTAQPDSAPAPGAGDAGETFEIVLSPGMGAYLEK